MVTTMFTSATVVKDPVYKVTADGKRYIEIPITCTEKKQEYPEWFWVRIFEDATCYDDASAMRISDKVNLTAKTSIKSRLTDGKKEVTTFYAVVNFDFCNSEEEREILRASARKKENQRSETTTSVKTVLSAFRQ